ncbi:MAG: TonB-dependent receptor domain-containing protein [Usitatibacter sp.]
MKPLPIAGLFTLAALGAQAQSGNLQYPRNLDTVIVTATRSLAGGFTLRDATFITRDEIESAGSLSLGELLERRAGVELRATGGPGQPQGIFIRGAGAAQTLVLIDGLRVGSATQGTTSIENIPLEMIERIEVVKGPMSSLYGSEAAGGVIQIFTRGKSVPHLFVSTAYGTSNDRRVSAGLATAEKDTVLSLAMGARKVDAPSATNPRATFSYDPDKDPHENAFANLHASQRLWQGEILALDAFVSRARTRFDAGIPFDGIPVDDRSDQTISGARFSSSTNFMPWWSSRLTVGQGRDKLVFHGQFPSQIETRQDQAGWINEFATLGGTMVAGLETVRQSVRSDESLVYARDRRDTNSGFVSLTQDLQGQRFEGSVRRDDDDQFGTRNTGSVSYGVDWPQGARLSATFARGFRAPTFNDLYARFPGYIPNPDLLPERSYSREIALRSAAGAATSWRLTAFDNRFNDLIVFDGVAGTVKNVASARIRGIEASVDANWLGVRWRAGATAQRPRDEQTGLRLQSRAERFATIDASRSFGAWTAGLTVHASGNRFDSTNEAPASRMPGQGVVDARVRYVFAKQWTVELTGANLADKRYESAVGYDAPRRSVMLNLRFDAF